MDIGNSENYLGITNTPLKLWFLFSRRVRCSKMYLYNVCMFGYFDPVSIFLDNKNK